MLTIIAFTIPCLGFLVLGFLMHEAFKRDLAAVDRSHAAKVAALTAVHDEILGREREMYAELHDQFETARSESLDLMTSNICLTNDLHWARLALAVQVAGDDFRGDVLGAGAKVVDLAERRAR
ncbi:hypothetical protein ACFJIY_07525 [Pimelobacter simplex]|uniref:hypothetical protein n=1 Tax=Nocardioides simplex TaxID=2045 RepID=UPI00366CB429